MSIHQTAIISSKATIGKNTGIGAFSVIEDDVIIGDNCKILNGVTLCNGSRVGDDVTIHQGAIIGGAPQVNNWHDQPTICEIGSGTTIREMVTISRASDPQNKTSVGRNCYIMAYTHAAHDVVMGDNVTIANSVQLAGHVTIGSNVGIGGMAAIHQFSKIGDFAFVGGTCGVNKDIPPYAMIMGAPARFSGINKVGLSRNGFAPQIQRSIKQTYRSIFKSDKCRSEAVKELSAQQDLVPEVKNILNFFAASDRGVIASSKPKAANVALLHNKKLAS